MKTFTLFLAALVSSLGWLTPAAQAQTCAAPTYAVIGNVTNAGAVVSFTPSVTAASYTVRFYSIDSTVADTTSINTPLSR